MRAEDVKIKRNDENFSNNTVDRQKNENPYKEEEKKEMIFYHV